MLEEMEMIGLEGKRHTRLVDGKKNIVCCELYAVATWKNRFSFGSACVG